MIGSSKNTYQSFKYLLLTLTLLSCSSYTTKEIKSFYPINTNGARWIERIDISEDSSVCSKNSSWNMGNQDLLLLKSNGNEKCDIYLKFSLKKIDDPNYKKSFLVLKIFGSKVTKKENSCRVGLFNISSEWNESTITWLNRPFSLGSPISIYIIKPTLLSNYLSFDITNWLNSIQNGSLTNRGILIKFIDCNKDGNLILFFSRENRAPNFSPHIELIY